MLLQPKHLKYFLLISSFFYGFTGVALLFFPEEIAAYFQLDMDPGSSLLIQLMGTLYLGFAFLNQSTAKGPMEPQFLKSVLATNLGHSLMAGLTLVNSVGQLNAPFAYVIGLLCLTYLTIGLMCGRLILRPPVNPKHV